MILALLVSAATIGWGASTASADHDAVPAPIVTQADGHGTIWEASNSCYYPNCTAAHQAGEGDIPPNSRITATGKTATVMASRVSGS